MIEFQIDEDAWMEVPTLEAAIDAALNTVELGPNMANPARFHFALRRDRGNAVAYTCSPRALDVDTEERARLLITHLWNMMKETVT